VTQKLVARVFAHLPGIPETDVTVIGHARFPSILGLGASKKFALFDFDLIFLSSTQNLPSLFALKVVSVFMVFGQRSGLNFSDEILNSKIDMSSIYFPFHEGISIKSF